METNFENFFDKIDKDEFEVLWNKIQRFKKKYKIAVLVFGIIINIIIGIFLFYIFEKLGLILEINLLLCILCLLILDLFIYTISIVARSLEREKEYSKLYKEYIIRDLINNFIEDASYKPYKGMLKSMYDSGEYQEYYNEYESDDYVEGKIFDKYPIRMAEVHTIEIDHDTDSDGSSSVRFITKFQGLFAQIVISKNIGCDIRIRNYEVFKQKNEIKMDSEEFEELFDVDTDDRIKAMQFLTHDVMDELIKFRKVLKYPFDIFITDNIIYIRLHVGLLFESLINDREIINKGAVRKYFHTLDFLLKLSDKIISTAEESNL